MADEVKKQEIKIELAPDIAEGTYANATIVSHSVSEFIMDFIRMVPNMPQAKVKSRIIMTPEHAKGLMRTLEIQIQKYEETFGPIRNEVVPDRTAHPFPIDLKNTGEA